MATNPDIAKFVGEVIGSLTPYFALSAAEFAKALGKDMYTRMPSLLSKLREYWSGDQSALESLTNYEKDPENYQAAMKDLLQRALQEDPQFATELERIYRGPQPTIEVTQEIKEGDGIKGVEAKRMRSGSVNVSQTIETASNATGVSIDEIG